MKEQDLVQPFVEGLADIVDMAAIQKAGLTLGVDPLGVPVSNTGSVLASITTST